MNDPDLENYNIGQIADALVGHSMLQVPSFLLFFSFLPFYTFISSFFFFISFVLFSWLILMFNNRILI